MNQWITKNLETQFDFDGVGLFLAEGPGEKPKHLNVITILLFIKHLSPASSIELMGKSGSACFIVSQELPKAREGRKKPNRAHYPNQHHFEDGSIWFGTDKWCLTVY